MKRAYLKKIFKILAAVDSVWILEQVYRCAVNMVKGTEYELQEADNYYKNLIIELLDKIDNRKFLNRIYVSLREHVKESEV